MSKIEVNTIDTIAGSTTLTLGSTNATLITLDSGAKFSNVSGQNYPAFLAKKTDTQSMSGDTDTKLICTEEIFDTNNAHNTTTGQFTVPSGQSGKYYFFAGFSVANLNDNRAFGVSFKINGSFPDGETSALGGYFSAQNTSPTAGNAADPTVIVSTIFDLSAGDYVEMWGRQRDGGSEDARDLRFGAFRIGA